MPRCPYRQMPDEANAIRCTGEAGHSGDHDFSDDPQPVRGTIPAEFVIE